MFSDIWKSSFEMRLTLSQTSLDFYVSVVQAFENTEGKGEIARNKQFLLFPQCFLAIWRTLSFSSNSKGPMWLSGKVFDL